MTAVLCDRCGMGTESCPACGSIVCDNCVKECQQCGNLVCKECLDRRGVCSVCREKEAEESYD